ncbi:MAG: putative lipid II flippase FtsW [Elusimicrobia bacterium]|nr:putative lipid II flippase FtsW [Elusimicrobiota bacterium]
MNTRTYGSPGQHVSLFSRGFHIDFVLLFSVLVTVVVGLLTIYSTEVSGGSGYVLRQLTAAAVGFVGLVLLTLLPYQIFRTYVRPLYVVMILVLIGVLIFGSNLRGTRGWFNLGPIYIQSSEIAKPLFVLTLAGYLDQRIQWHTPKSLVVPFVIAFFPIALIIIQPDFSSSLVFIPVAFVMFFVAGARALHLLALSLVGVLAVGIPLASTYFTLLGESLKKAPVLYFFALAFKGGWPGVWMFLGICAALISVWWFLRKMRVFIPSLYLWVTLTLILTGIVGAMATNRVIKVYQRKRLVAFVNPSLDPLGGGYNVRQSQISIGSGRIIGKGYGKGTQSRLGFLPSRHTDFIFSVIGEELGFVRAVVILAFYFLIVWRGFEISLVARDRFGGMVAAGFATMFAFYALLNLGMTMGLAPVAGVPLPLVSYGGSSMVSSMLAVGLLLSIHWRRYML